MAQYAWKTGGPKPAVDPQIFGETVEKIAGNLTAAKPEDIVEAARSKKSPIHQMFEWRDDHAAELYRQVQARHFIGALQIVRVQFSDGPTVSNRAFFSVSTEAGTGYVEHERIMNDQDFKKQVLEDMRSDLEKIIRKFGAVMAMGNFIPRLQAIIDDMRDNADAVLVQATNRRAAAKEKAFSEDHPRA